MDARIALAALLACSCSATARVGDLDFVSTEKVAVRSAIVKRNVTGRSCTTFLFSGLPNMVEALEQAQRTVADGEALANVAVYVERHYYYVATQLCYVVIGDVVRLESRELGLASP